MQSMAGRVEFKWIPLHLATEAQWDTRYDADFMADVAMMWEQVETGPTSAHRAKLYERIPRNCPVVKFPPLTALFFGHSQAMTRALPLTRYAIHGPTLRGHAGR